MPLLHCVVDDTLVLVWEHTDQHVIDNAMKQWHKCIHACVAANGGHFELNICCERHTTFAVNADFCCHINRCSAFENINLVLCLFT